MTPGVDPQLQRLVDLLSIKFPWMNISYGFNPNAERGFAKQWLYVEIAKDLVGLVVSRKGAKWSANAIVIEHGKPAFNKEETAKVKGPVLVFMWAVTQLRRTYRDTADLYRQSQPAFAAGLDAVREQIELDLSAPL